QIVAIALVHPDNPTGYVYPRDVMLEIIDIAREHDLFIICDEVYAHITFNGAETCHLSTVIGDVPALSLRGISKEYPWPGARCGWIEILNRGKDREFDRYADALIKSKMMEVCSTTLPQLSIPRVFGDPRYPDHLKARAKMFEDRANEAYDFFSELDCVTVHRVQGALYFPVVFNEGVLNYNQALPIENPKAKALIEELVKDVPDDKRFVYYLMASAGVCVTPLCGFHSELQGFRITLLQANDELRRDTLKRISTAIQAYVSS
ncbi:MAG: aminotransferase class I/II-fold pyridoxal phosphate-dependent enzyme, partial [Planctomycetota bacterium]